MSALDETGGEHPRPDSDDEVPSGPRVPDLGDPGSGGLLPALAVVVGWAGLVGVLGHRWGWWAPPEEGFLAMVRTVPAGYWSGSYCASLVDSMPEGLLCTGVVGLLAGVRRPGWVAALFVCGALLSVLPVWLAWIQYWDFYQRMTQIALALALLLCAALIDGMRAHRISARAGGSVAGHG
ncbi:hypothetical protein [Frankia sp. R43]|uniref:hypothetical protein n=1 Tax=Frankia sp. R43 TaxID=269536 RepID=UPI0006CA2E21|nr:hypothetical protein [Frankia sp. R43]